MQPNYIKNNTKYNNSIYIKNNQQFYLEIKQNLLRQSSLVTFLTSYFNI